MRGELCSRRFPCHWRPLTNDFALSVINFLWTLIGLQPRDLPGCWLASYFLSLMWNLISPCYKHFIWSGKWRCPDIKHYKFTWSEEIKPLPGAQHSHCLGGTGGQRAPACVKFEWQKGAGAAPDPQSLCSSDTLHCCAGGQSTAQGSQPSAALPVSPGPWCPALLWPPSRWHQANPLHPELGYWAFAPVVSSSNMQNSKPSLIQLPDLKIRSSLLLDVLW